MVPRQGGARGTIGYARPMNEIVLELGAASLTVLELLLGGGLLLVGVVLGALLLGRRSASAKKLAALETELEEERQQAAGYREAVTKHFDGTSDLFRDLTRNYAALYAHLAEGARGLSPDRVPELGRGYADPALRIGTSPDEEPSEPERGASE